MPLRHYFYGSADWLGRPENQVKSTVFVAADVKTELIVFVFVFLQEDVGIVVAEFFVDFDIIGLGDFFLTRFLGVGILEADVFLEEDEDEDDELGFDVGGDEDR